MLEDIFQTMNTIAQIKVVGGDEGSALITAKEVILGFEKRFSVFDPKSEVSELNSKSKKGVEYSISGSLYEVLAVAEELREASSGLFDVTFSSKGFKNSYRLNGQNSSILFGEPIKINLGAIAKGYAADLAIKKTKEFSPQRVLINIGGHINCFSDDCAWQVGLQDPTEDFGQLVGVIRLSGGSFSTSAENYRGSHIKNPLNSKWQSDYLSVSVTHPLGVYADALSTALFLSNKEQFVRLCKKYQLNVIIISGDKISVSKEIIGLFDLQDTKYKLIVL